MLAVTRTSQPAQARRTLTQSEACRLLVRLCHVRFGTVLVFAREGKAYDVVANPTYKKHELDQPGRAPDFTDPRLLEAAEVIVHHQGMKGGYAVIDVHEGAPTGLHPFHCRNWPGHTSP
jgi:hypothetical protein